VSFVGDAMVAVVQGVDEVHRFVGEPPVVVGGLAVMSRLTSPYRATVDLDVVDRQRGQRPHLELLRAAPGAQAVEPAALLLPTLYGPVRIDVLEVRQVEIDEPSDDPGDRLHANSHAWASDTATEITLEVFAADGATVVATTRVAEPGPLIAMKLQAIMNRNAEKQGTDLLDIVRLVLDPVAGPAALSQLRSVDAALAADIDRHVDLWLDQRRRQALGWILSLGGNDVTADHLVPASELLHEA
jgi:hypothetical protein